MGKRCEILIFVWLFVITGCAPDNKAQKKQDFSIKIEELVMSENQIGQEYFFKVLLQKEVLEYKLAYLGAISNKQEGKLRFVYATTYAGSDEDAKHANSVIVLYNDKDQRIGQYYIGGGFDTIPTIIHEDLVTTYNNQDCNQITNINFGDSIPKQIYIHCNEQHGKMFGDLYTFSRDSI